MAHLLASARHDALRRQQPILPSPTKNATWISPPSSVSPWEGTRVSDVTRVARQAQLAGTPRQVPQPTRSPGPRAAGAWAAP